MNGEGSLYQRKSDSRWFGSILEPDGEGRLKRKTVSAKTKDSARLKLKRLIEEQELLEAEGLPPMDTTVTVSQLLDRWHKVIVATRRETTAANYRYMIDGHIVPFILPGGRTLGSLKVAKLTFSDVDALLDAKREAGMSASTRRLIRSVVVQATNQAMKWRIVTRNEAAMSTHVAVKRAEGRSLSPAQAKRLMETLKTCPMGALFTVMLTTGLRRGEAIGLRWEDVDLEKGVISVRQQVQRINGELKATEVKTERSRRSVNLAKPTVVALKEHKARQTSERLASLAWTDTGYVFTTGLGTPLDPRNVAKQFESNCLKAEVGKWHPHELRHSAATLMLAAGTPLQVVSAVLGHASIRITSDVYGHVLDPQRQDAADALARVLYG
ncbi:MAG: site-specific integrase [Acidimicrobiales bacterium]